MNVADSREYRLALESTGFTPADTEFSADLLIVNTCSVRSKAEEKLVSYLGAVQAAKGRNPGLKVGLVGCTATLKGDELRKKFNIIGFILPATDVDSFPEVLSGFAHGKNFSSAPGIADIPEKERWERFVTIMRGCESYCTYCVVPHARGKIRSLSITDIIRRCEEASAQGTRIITLLGQNVMAYGHPLGNDDNSPRDFESLLRVLSEGFPDIWFKFLTSHPAYVTTSLIDYIALTPNISRHFHLPIQSGDNRVLHDMNRGYTSDEYKTLIGYIREKIPGCRISTDVIAGFPTEDEAAFENTMRLAEELKFDQMFTFQYSPRSGTVAVKWQDPVSFDEKRQRLQRLIDLQNDIVRQKHSAMVGMHLPAVIYGRAEKDPEKLMAVSRESDVILIPDCKAVPGEIVEVEITAGLQRTLIGKII